MNKLTPFHLAIPVDNLSRCRVFYKQILGCKEGRSSNHWVDFDFFGHQLVIHYKEKSIESHIVILLMEKMFLCHILESYYSGISFRNCRLDLGQKM